MDKNTKKGIKQPLVSVCVPIYGVEKYIGRCAESLFAQTYQNMEFVFVNDCTKDHSIEILKETLDSYPERKQQVRIINHSTNKGLAAARNTAIENATSDFILNVDSDDWVNNDLVDKLVKQQVKTNADIVTCSYTNVSEHNSRIIDCSYSGSSESLALDMFMRKQPSQIWGRLIRKELYIQNGIQCKEGLNMGEDFQVTPKLYYFAHKISFIKEALYNYRFMASDSYSAKFNHKRLYQEWASFDILKTFFEQFKGKYLKEIEYAELRSIVMYLVFASRYNNKEYYTEAKNRLSKIDKRYWKLIDLPMRVLLFLSDNFFIMKFYSNFSTYIKHLMER